MTRAYAALHVQGNNAARANIPSLPPQQYAQPPQAQQRPGLPPGLASGASFLNGTAQVRPLGQPLNQPQAQTLPGAQVSRPQVVVVMRCVLGYEWRAMAGREGAAWARKSGVATGNSSARFAAVMVQLGWQYGSLGFLQPLEGPRRA